MWTRSVVSVLLVASYEVQLPSREDCHLSDSFVLKRLCPPPGVCPQVRSMHGYFVNIQDRDFNTVSNSGGFFSSLSRRMIVAGGLLGIFENALRLLRLPRQCQDGERLRRDTIGRADAEESQHAQIHQPLRRPDRLGENATLPRRFGMSADELCPRPATSFKHGNNALCLEDHLHGLPRDVRDAELAKFTQDAGIAPAVFTGESHKEFWNVSGSPGTPDTLRRLFVSEVSGLGLSPQRQKDAIADNRNKPAQQRAEVTSQCQEPTPLARRDAYSRRQARTQDAIFHSQENDLPGQLLMSE